MGARRDSPRLSSACPGQDGCAKKPDMIEGHGLRAFHFGSFRSFRDATLPLGPLTLLVGLNASGKSNAREGLQLLSWMSRGRRLDDILRAAQDAETAVRGRYSDLGYHGAASFRLGCSFDVTLSDAPEHLRWDLTLKVDATGLRVHDERLSIADRPWYWLDGPAAGVLHDVSVRYENFKRGRPDRKPLTRCTDLLPALVQLVSPAAFREEDVRARESIPAVSEALRAQLDTMVLLDPNPPKMRQASITGDRRLRADGSNLSGVLHHLCEREGLQRDVLAFVSALPEQHIEALDFLPGLPDQVILRVCEAFGKPVFRDASLLSDGTLRVLSIAASLLSAPEGGLVVVEEVDNGIHPSRASELMSNIHKIATRRALRVLVTSHNPALADALPLEALRDVVVCHRHPRSGESRLTRLGDVPHALLAAASGSLGRLMTSGALQQEVADERSMEARAADALQAIRDVFGEGLSP